MLSGVSFEATSNAEDLFDSKFEIAYSSTDPMYSLAIPGLPLLPRPRSDDVAVDIRILVPWPITRPPMLLIAPRNPTLGEVLHLPRNN